MTRRVPYLLAALLIAALCMAFGGCATCRTHPVACSVAGAFVVGSIAATAAAHNHHALETGCGAPGNAVIGSCVLKKPSL